MKAKLEAPQLVVVTGVALTSESDIETADDRHSAT